MRIKWEFPHPETGIVCSAVFDGHILEVSATYWCADCMGPCDEDRHATDRTDDLLDRRGMARTCCASRDIAYRELRCFGADSIDLDRSEAVL